MKFFFDIFILLFYTIGLFIIFKQTKKVDWKFYLFIWTFTSFVLYLISLELQAKTFYFFIPLLFLVLFLFVYFREKRRLINGFLFNLFLISSGIYLLFLVAKTEDPFLLLFLAIVGILLLLLLVFGLYALVLFLYWNGFVVLRKEGRSIANLLTLLLAIGLTLFLVINSFYVHFLPPWAATLFGIVPALLFYFFVVFYNFLTISVIYQFNRPAYKQDFIIVLGSGLIDGKIVPPLLGNRIKKAIQFYKAQTRATLHSPKIIMSGGKGDDEHVAEAIAMKQYVVEMGIPDEDILIEANSKNTLENMRFSREVIEQQTDSKPFNIIFSTNSFHLFRAGLFAKMANLKADGIGAKTAFYFLPNAFLREFIAIVVMRKQRHLILCGLIISLFILLSIIQAFFVF